MEELVDIYIGRDNVKTIIEAGACDCEDSVKLSGQYPNAHIYAFECNPETLPLCREAIKGKNITLTEKAVSDINGEVTFYPIDTDKTVTTHANGNPGASSMFKSSGLYPTETYVQGEITVPSVSLKTFCSEKQIESIDILWLDAQGAELNILKGLGDMLDEVKIIKTEVMFKEQYTGTPLADDVIDFLESKNFRVVRYLEKYEWFGDILALNTKI